MSCVEYLREQLYQLEQDAEELETLREDLQTTKMFRKLQIHNMEDCD